jgi:hypothetical protein
MTSVLRNFIPGDRVEGTKAEFWKRRGAIAESHASLPKTKILVRWDDDEFDEVVPRASLKILDVGTENALHEDNDESDGGSESTVATSDQDNEDVSSEEMDMWDEEEVEVESQTEEDEEVPVPTVPSSSENANAQSAAGTSTGATSVQNRPPQPPTSGDRGNGGRGGRGGRGSRAGRGQRTTVSTPSTQPPIPPLHAVLKKATKTKPAIVREWTEVPNVVQDLQTGFATYDQYSRLNWRDPSVALFAPDLDLPAVKSPLQYFLLMFPMQRVDSILDCTNSTLRSWRRGHPITRGELFRFIGLRLMMALYPRCSDEGLDFYWTTEADPDAIFSPIFDFENKCGMSKSRFEAINTCLRLDTFVPNSVNEDPYQSIQSFVDGFNWRMKTVVVPGKFIIVDELMSFWKGVESHFSHESFIHVTYVPRKPVNLGVEFKCSADGQSNIMLFLEIQKGSHAAKQRYETEPEKLPFHCAVTLRTVDNWAGTGRVCVADAAFGSLITCLELLKRGLYFIGIVKGCTKGYPIVYAQNFLASNPVKNEYKVITTTVQDGTGTNRTIMSVLLCLRHGLIRQIISSYSSSLLGNEKRIARSIRKQNEHEGMWFNEREIETVRRPKVFDEGMQHFGAVDYNDRFRQGYLNWEQAWSTKKIWKRMFTTVLGVIATNAYFAYRLETHSAATTDDERDDKLKFFGFLNRVAQQLITNKFDHDEPIASGLRSRSSPPAVSPGLRVPTLMALNDVPSIRNRFDATSEQGRKAHQKYQRYCATCTLPNKTGRASRVKASYFCSVCSDPSLNKFVCFCGPRVKRTCWMDHLLTCHSQSSEEIL